MSINNFGGPTDPSNSPSVSAWAEAVRDELVALRADVDALTGGAGSVPDGGTTGQVLGKLSNTDQDIDWIDAAAGGGGGLGWAARTDDPLTSLTDLDTYTGTWDIDGTLRLVDATSSQSRALSVDFHPAVSVEPHNIVEVEIQIPSDFLGNSGKHIGVGFVPSNAGGYWTARIRGDGYAYFERDSAAAGPTAAISGGLPAVGEWVKVRMKWNSGGYYTMYLDGVQVLTHSDGAINWISGGMKPYIVAQPNGTSMTVHFRNFKSWQYALDDPA